ncbi:MAG: nucleotidyltransferase domain-containing protein [Deltaproteobacteria bacterium]|nr:nucleotidyltransferase domain-containing protein [Deltaproteobacteria bacterium]
MPDITKELKMFFKEIIENSSCIVVVYLFGSYAKGKEKALSDMDLAFLIDEKAYKADPFNTTGRAYMTAMRIGTKFWKETDVIILNSSSIELAYEAVSSGCCVYEADQDRRLEYETKIRGMYYDFMPFIMELRSRFLSRL